MTNDIDDNQSMPAMVIADEVSTEGTVARDEGDKRSRREVTRLREQLRSAQAEHDAALTTIRAQSRDRLLRSELRSEAVRAGIVDLDGLQLADTSAITFSDDGAIDGAEAVINGLKLSKPYLFAASKDKANVGATTSLVARVPLPAKPELVDARSLTREQWQTERARLLSRRS